MECRTDDNRDYDVVKAKIPKRDKAGNDISSDKMGPGGRRKEDGTLSALAYDFELVEDSKDFGPDDTEEMLRELLSRVNFKELPPAIYLGRR